ncbi:hypothetical protein XH89_20185 [Bradyrhizobium sp. CCBAU 53340]|nr:hypothetical protein XH89_20185 [Bradyrhizobium sp. CCBAU 53340]
MSQIRPFACGLAIFTAMAHIVFTCPTTAFKVQQWLDEESDDNSLGDQYESIVCPACTKIHFINRRTGKLLGEK